VLINFPPNFNEKFEVFVSYSLGIDAPNFLAKASDRRVRADNGSVGQTPEGSWAKWVNKSEWITSMGHGSVRVTH